jgi:hypothetical protein
MAEILKTVAEMITQVGAHKCNLKKRINGVTATGLDYLLFVKIINLHNCKRALNK